MSIIIKRVMAICELPIGINVLRNDGLTAMALAATTGAQFVRVNVFTGAMLTDQGIIEGIAHELLLYRKHLNAQRNVKIFADVMVKHAQPLALGQTIAQEARDAVERGLADAIVVSGFATGSAPVLDDIKAVREALPDTPIVIGSGISRDNIGELFSIADGAIVASSLKRQGILANPVDVERVRALVSQVKQPART